MVIQLALFLVSVKAQNTGLLLQFDLLSCRIIIIIHSYKQIKIKQTDRHAPPPYHLTLLHHLHNQNKTLNISPHYHITTFISLNVIVVTYAFIVSFLQITGTFISTLTHITTQWWIFSTIKNICDTKKLPVGSPWTCPSEHSDYAMSMIWGGLGPKRMFVSHSQFSNMYIYVIIGVIATVVTWALSRIFSEKKWIGLIHIPLIFLSGVNQPPAGAVNYWSSFVVAILFKVVIYKKYKEWWGKYNYLLCSGLSVGITFMQLLLSWSLQMKGEGVYGLQWWGLEYSDHCHLAQCPTAPGIKVDGCPVFK